jgi:hypothetical protein
MSTFHASSVSRLYLSAGLSVLIMCSLTTLAQARSVSSMDEAFGREDAMATSKSKSLAATYANCTNYANRQGVPQLLADDQTMRTTYFNPDSSGTAGQSASSKSAKTKLPNQLINSTAHQSGYTPGANQAMPSSPAYSPTAGNGDIPPAVQRLIGAGHVRSAVPNPATTPFQSGENAREAEHQRVLNNMRAHGYSEARIKAAEPYIHQSEAPGTTYRNVMGIKVRNDGMTVDQAFNNMKNNGVMNTPIYSNPNRYAPGSYGYYKGHGGTKTFGQWLDGAR